MANSTQRGQAANDRFTPPRLSGRGYVGTAAAARAAEPQAPRGRSASPLLSAEDHLNVARAPKLTSALREGARAVEHWAADGVDRLRGWATKTPPGQALGAADDLSRNRNAMIEADWIGADKYFHCKGNCEAAQRGDVGEWAAQHLSNARESYGKLKGDPHWDALEDQDANRLGRLQGRAAPAQACSVSCAALRPAGLPKRY